MMKGLNISGTLNAFRTLANPTLLLPHLTVSSFDALPYPLTSAFPPGADIRAVVLDKDNCFAIPHELEVYGPYKARLHLLQQEFPPPHLLIVSNTSGTPTHDPHLQQSAALTNTLSIPVLAHHTPKPGCHAAILDHFRAQPGSTVTAPEHIAIVGDRLCTDVLMANMMGAWAVWVRDGVVVGTDAEGGGHYRGALAGMERWVEERMRRMGWTPKLPKMATGSAGGGREGK